MLKSFAYQTITENIRLNLLTRKGVTVWAELDYKRKNAPAFHTLNIDYAVVYNYLGKGGN